MTATIKCPSHNFVEICAILGFNSGKDGLTILDGCGYCDEYGQCRYRGRIKKERKEPEHHKEHSMPEHRKDRKEPGEVEDRKDRRERRRVQVSLHAFLGGGSA